MFNKRPKLNQLLRLLRHQPLKAEEVKDSQERVWSSLVQQLNQSSLHMDNQPISEASPTLSTPAMLFGLRRTYAFAAIGSLAGIVAVGGLTYMQLHKPTTPTPIVAIASPTPLPTSPLPTATASITPTPTGTATAAPTATPNTRAELAKIQLNKVASHASVASYTATTGVRNPIQKTSWLRQALMPSAHADTAFGTRAYPAVYYVDPNAGRTQIKEINVYTGETKVVVTEQRIITQAFFSTTKQTLVYTVIGGDDKYYPPVDVKLFNLDTNKTTTVGTSRMPTGKLSPNGLSFAYWQTSQEAASSPSALIVYHLDSGATQIISAQNITGDSILQAGDFSWSSDSALTVSIMGYKGENIDKNLDTKFTIKKIDVNVPGGISTLTTKTSDNFFRQLLVGNRVFTNAYDKAESMNYASVNGRPPVRVKPSTGQFGWLSYVDLTTGTLTDLRSQTGDFLADWIVSADATKVVYSRVETLPTDGIKTRLDVIDLGTKKVTALPTPDGDFSIIGWNGNEENLVVQSKTSLKFYNVNVTDKILTAITQ